tara:strand:- start:5376 stop:7016 length:1641 start_codon:yes stop_codon:yes gene_type:complete
MSEEMPLDQITTQNPKFDKLLASVEKQMGIQSTLLKSLIETQEKQLKSQVEADEDAKRKSENESVSGDDEKTKGKDGKMMGLKPLFESFMKNGLGKESGGLGIFGKNLLKGGAILALAPMLKGFVDGFIDRGLEDFFGIDAENNAAFTGAIKKGALFAAIGGMFSRKLILPGLLMGIGASLGPALADSAINVFDWSAETMSKITGSIGAVLGVALPTIIGASIGALKNKIVKIFTPKVVTEVIDAVLPDNFKPGGATGPLKLSPPPGTPDAQFKSKAPGGGRSNKVVQKLPSGTAVNPAGAAKKPRLRLPNGRFATVAQVEAAMKAEGKLARLAKFTKFLRFAGPAMAVIPALMDPVMAIYNGAPEDEVKKQIVGALGSISGGVLGSMAGFAFGSALPGFGNIIGGLAGGIGGALMGESLTEELADYLMGTGPAPDPNRVRVKHGRSTKMVTLKPGDKGYVTPQMDASANTISQSAETTSGTASKVALMAPGGSLQAAGGGSNNVSVNKGGDQVNNTNVGGSSSTVNIFNTGGGSLANGHLPVAMS